MLSNYDFKGFDQIESKDAKFLKFKKDISQEEIFSVDKKHLSWGFGNKMYCWDNNSLIVNEFKQYVVNNGSDGTWFGNAKKIPLDLNSKELVVNGGVSFFGVIVELEGRLLIIGHGINNEISYKNIEASITKWRIFPRSQRYENQIHIIFDDYLQISAVTNDYFGRKDKKDLGLKYNKKL